MKKSFYFVGLVFHVLFFPFIVDASAPPKGSDRLRELAIFPKMNFDAKFCGLVSCRPLWEIDSDEVLSDQIADAHEQLKQSSDNTRLIMQLGRLLYKNSQTNETRIIFEKAEKLLRKKLMENPEDHDSLMELGDALWNLEKPSEAEAIYRKAILVDSNDWKCWVRLGSFLAEESTARLVPQNQSFEISAKRF